MQLARLAVVTAAAVLCSAEPALAQRGGRGRPEAITNRVGSFFVDVELPADRPAGQDPLLATALATDSRQSGQLLLLYVYDSMADPNGQRQFEQTMFGNDEVGIALRCFRCGRIDVNRWPDSKDKEKMQKRAPVFVAVDETGARTGELAMTGYKAAINPLMDLLAKAASGHVEPSLAKFVERYRDLVRDLERVETQRRTLDDQLARLGRKDEPKRAELEKERKQLDGQQQKLEASEQELIGKARVVPRDEKARRLGGRERGEWGGGRGGGGPGGPGGGGPPGGGPGGPAGGGGGRGGG